MLRNYNWLVGLVIVTLLLPIPVLSDELSGTLEVGASSVGVNDDGSKVNEYVKGSVDDGETVTGKIAIEAQNENAAIEINATSRGANDATAEAAIDVGRVIRIKGSYSVLEHLLDHDRLNYLDAAVDRGPAGAVNTNPPTAIGAIDPNLVPAYYLVDPDASSGSTYWGSSTGDFTSIVAGADALVVQTGGASLLGEDLTPNAAFSIVREEAEAEMQVALPFLPGVTLSTGFHQETRKGTEQAIGMSKCSSCHITGEAQTVDEITTDLKAGLTGKFGPLTVEYELTDREFNDKTNDPTMRYDRVMKPGQPFNNNIFQNRTTYDYYDGERPYDQSPDSEKTTHALKARVDLPKNTTIVGSFITSETESKKTDEPGIFTLAEDKLKASYDGYGFKAVSRFGKNLRISAFAKIAETDVDDANITYELMDPASPGAGMTVPINATFPDLRTETTGTRDSLNAGFDVVWRLARKSTLRLGYEYDVQDREWDALETTTHTVKAKYNTRIGKDLKLRVGYQYEKADDVFLNPDAALVPVTDNRVLTNPAFGYPGYIVGGNSMLYGTSFYDMRTANLSNLPEDSHELNASATWSPSVTFAATFSVRYAMQENDLGASTWKQDTLVPTLSAWYAASDNLKLTAAYNYFDQRTETAFCQGFYDG